MPGVPPKTGKRRFVIDIDEEVYDKLRVHLSIYGTQKAFFEVIITDMIKLMEEHGPAFIAAVLERRLEMNQFFQGYIHSTRKEESSGDTL